MVATEYRGHQIVMSEGPSGTEVTVGGVQSLQYSYNNNATASFKAGSRAAFVLGMGNIEIAGSLSKAFVGLEYLDQVMGYRTKINYVGINFGGSSHTATFKDDTETNVQADPASYGGTEFANGDYDSIEADDANIMTKTCSTNGQMMGYMFKFDNITTKANIDFVTFEFVGYGTGDTNGVEVLVWDETNSEWDSLVTNTSATNTSVTISLETVTDYVNASNDIFFLVQNRVNKTTANNVLYCDYAELRVYNTTTNNEVNATSIKTLANDGAATVTTTIAGVKFIDWNFEYGSDGAMVVENVTFLATGISQTQA